LLPEPIVEALKHESLSTVIAAAKSLDSDTPQHGSIDSEYLCWSLMDHILAYPYQHPDGYAPGTAEFLDWRVSMSKQYAILLLQEHTLKIQLKALPKGLLCDFNMDDELQTWIKIDKEGGKEACKVPSDVPELQQEYRIICGKLRNFHHEQRILQKHYLRFVKACAGTEDKVGKSSDKFDNTSTLKYTGSSLVLVPLLFCGQKRKAIESATRSSGSRKQDGHVFSRAQKKQRKTRHHVAADIVDDKQACPTVVCIFDKVKREDCYATNDDWVMLEVEKAGSEAEEGDEVTLVDMETLSGIFVKTGAGPKAPTVMSDDPGAITPLIEVMHVTRDKSQDVSNTCAHQVNLSLQLDIFEEIEGMLAGLDQEFDKVMTVCHGINLALCTGEAMEALTCKEIADFIPVGGGRFVDVVDRFVDRIPDTTLGMKLLRELIDEAGLIDKSTDMVYRREPLPFVGILDD
jgi:hypothetical protein